jgi:hypothetical protein
MLSSNGFEKIQNDRDIADGAKIVFVFVFEPKLQLHLTNFQTLHRFVNVF